MRHTYRQVISIEMLETAPLEILRWFNDKARHRFKQLGLVKGPMHAYRENYAGIELVCLEWESLDE